jgi:hypothetical protein
VTIFNGVFKSTNGGKSWNAINRGLSDSNPAMGLEVDPIMPGILYLTTYVGGVLKSTNGGESWNAVNNGLDLDTAYENSIAELVIDPVTSTTLYVLTRNKGIFKSANSGQNWIAFDTGLPLTDIDNSTFLIDPLTPTTLYIGTFSGEIFKTIDNGRNWSMYGTGLNNNPIRVLAVNPLMPTILYVGTYGGGVFTNQVNKTFAPVTMPSLTAAPLVTESPSTIPAPTENLSVLPTLRPAEFPFTASGTMKDRKQIQLPENARVVVVWVVTAGNPNYDYVFGEGTIDYGNKSFKIEFDEPPPSEALNWYDSGALGVGIVLITTGQRLENGVFSPDSVINTDVLGASGQYCIIYAEGNFETLGMGSWLKDFNQGYSVGKGIKIPSDFDGFEPIDPTTIEIIIDDLENIEFVNWT